jgi:hypothetical protein
MSSRSGHESNDDPLYHKRHNVTFPCRIYGKWKIFDCFCSGRQRKLKWLIAWAARAPNPLVSLHDPRMHDKSFGLSKAMCPTGAGPRQSKNLQMLLAWRRSARA